MALNVFKQSSFGIKLIKKENTQILLGFILTLHKISNRAVAISKLNDPKMVCYQCKNTIYPV
jgi:hypothetical protein